MNKKVVAFGEIMLRLSTPDYLRFSQSNSLNATFGGGEANVAVSLANYGIPVDYVTRLPQNDIGRACLMDLRKYGVGVENIVWGGERLGIYFLETGAVSRGSKVVYDRAHSSVSEIKIGMIDWEKVFKEPIGSIGQVLHLPFRKVPPMFALKPFKPQTNSESQFLAI
ncbi:hypothetical protein MASR2M47_28500 [Draconibacterium sp.]